MSNDQVTQSGGSVVPTNGFAVGLTLFAAVMMMMVGLFRRLSHCSMTRSMWPARSGCSRSTSRPGDGSTW